MTWWGWQPSVLQHAWTGLHAECIAGPHAQRPHTSMRRRMQVCKALQQIEARLKRVRLIPPADAMPAGGPSGARPVIYELMPDPELI
eukprot:365047-Chlamydomonas_euryale.AAC.15